jgi:hypothetical protein
MSTLRQAAQQALEALEQCGLDDTHRSYEFENAARAALRATLRKALAQEEPRRTGLPHCEHSCEANAFLIEIRRLKAELVAEREACADICDQHASVEGIAQRCAEQIRARGKT